MSAFIPAAADPTCHCYHDELHGLRGEYPEWGVWRSGTGRWWAFRTGRNPLTIDQLRAGCRILVHADTLSDLRAMMEEETRAARSAHEAMA